MRLDVAVFPGDILVGDDDGVMFIPARIVRMRLADECLQMGLGLRNFVIGKSIKMATDLLFGTLSLVG